MKITNTLLTILALFIFSNIAIAQSDAKANERADNKVEEINDMIVAANPEDGLTLEQKKLIKEKHLAKSIKIQAVKKNDSFTKEEKEQKIKILHKQFYKDMFNNVLTSNQRKAKKEGKIMTAKGGS